MFQNRHALYMDPFQMKPNSISGDVTATQRALARAQANTHHRIMTASPPPSPPQNTEIDLHGKLLIAMPDMADPRFAYSVIFMCAYSPEGAMGLVINKPTTELSLRDLLEQLEINGTAPTDRPIHFGGPVEHGRGFVLHDKGYFSDIATMDISPAFAMTATLDILEAIAEGKGPREALIALGYAGWGPGQLEAEIAQNAWLTVEADPELVFNTPDAMKWEVALSRLGISALTLSADAGHA
jgi:putative transcriptional regulator